MSEKEKETQSIDSDQKIDLLYVNGMYCVLHHVDWEYNICDKTHTIQTGFGMQMRL